MKNFIKRHLRFTIIVALIIIVFIKLGLNFLFGPTFGNIVFILLSIFVIILFFKTISN